MNFEFIVYGRPLSSGASRSTQAIWRQDVLNAALRVWPFSQKPIRDEISVTIINFYYLDKSKFDVDNIVKPILDALNKRIYRDDKQVSQVVARKTLVTPQLVLSDEPPLVSAGLISNDEFTYVKIHDAPDHSVLP